MLVNTKGKREIERDRDIETQRYRERKQVLGKERVYSSGAVCPAQAMTLLALL